MANFTPLPPLEDKVVAIIFQGGYGVAQGPRGDTRYLGTYGAISCMALGLVLARAGEDRPRIALGHFSILTDVEPSLHKMMVSIDHREDEHLKIYLVTSDFQINMFRALRRILMPRNVELYFDFDRSMPGALILDLENGLPVDPKAALDLLHFGLREDVIEDRIEMESSTRRRSSLICELDLLGNAPLKKMALYPKATSLPKAPLRTLKI